jgi:hypothetical protein
MLDDVFSNKVLNYSIALKYSVYFFRYFSIVEILFFFDFYYFQLSITQDDTQGKYLELELELSLSDFHASSR